MHHFVVQVEPSVSWMCVCLYVCLWNDMTFDLDIWHVGLPWQFLGQGHTSKVKGKIHGRKKETVGCVCTKQDKGTLAEKQTLIGNCK